MHIAIHMSMDVPMHVPMNMSIHTSAHKSAHRYADAAAEAKKEKNERGSGSSGNAITISASPTAYPLRGYARAVLKMTASPRRSF